MFHLAANFVALADTADTDVPALNDDVMTIQNNHFIPRDDLRLHAAYSSAVTLLRTRLNSPSIRQVVPSYLSPVGTALLPASRPPIADYRSNPFLVRKSEEFVVESTDSAAGPNNHYVLSWLFRERRQQPVGNVYGFRGTSTNAAVASTWTTITTTWLQTLPAGRYAVVGGQYIATNAVAFQVVFPDQVLRPGGLGQAAAGTIPWDGQLNGGLGVWGEFETVALPTIRVLNNSTDNAHVVILQIVRIG